MKKKKKKKESCSIKLLTLSGGGWRTRRQFEQYCTPCTWFFFFVPLKKQVWKQIHRDIITWMTPYMQTVLEKDKKKKKKEKEWMRKWIWHLETHFHLFRRKEEVALHFYSSVGTDVNIKRGKHPHRHRLHSNKLYTGAPLPQYPQQPVFIVTIHMYTG